MPVSVEIRTNPPDLFQRFERYPQRLDDELQAAMDKAMLHLQGSIPEYPAQNPATDYVRTGTLGRSIGLGGGKAEVHQVKRLGQGNYEGRIGTRVYYAQYVIGEGTQAEHVRRSAPWWTMKTVAEAAQEGIVRIFEAMAEKLAGWLDG